MKTILTTLTAAALIATSVAAKPPLREVPQIDDALLDLGIADIIRKECPDISARMLKAVGYLRGLHKQAKALGYTDDEIDAYTDSDAEKDRMRARGAAYFKTKGVDTSDPQSYCRLGKEEIAKGSRIGSLLRAR